MSTPEADHGLVLEEVGFGVGLCPSRVYRDDPEIAALENESDARWYRRQPWRWRMARRVERGLFRAAESRWLPRGVRAWCYRRAWGIPRELAQLCSATESTAARSEMATAGRPR